MLNFLKKTIKFLIPILILITGVSFVVVFEFFIKDKVDTVEVVVAANDIAFKDRITAEDLKTHRVKIGEEVEGSYTPDQAEYIIGEFASINISKGTQIYSDLIDSFDLIPDESKGEFIAPIPNDWLFAVPGSLRRSYVADIYVVGSDEQKMIEELIRDAQSHGDGDAAEVGEEDEMDSQTREEDDEESNNQTNVKKANEQVDQALSAGAKPILTDIRVASVKDSGNREVTQAPESNSPQSGTANVSDLEIIATPEILNTLQEHTSKGYGLYIVYKYERNEQSSEENKSVATSKGRDDE